MGNYFPSLPYLNYGTLAENNNKMDTSVAVLAKEPEMEPKIADYFSAVDVSADLSINRLQNQCKQDSFVVTRLWNKLNDLYQATKRYISYEDKQIVLITTTLESSCETERELDSDNFIRFRFNCNKSQKDCLRRSPDRPDRLFQRLDSGIEDTPRRIRTQVDLDSIYLTAVVNMADSPQSSLFKQDLICVNTRYKKSISFFIDIRDPFKQKPLGEKYKFMSCDECDSMFSDECSSESCIDDDFIVFEDCCAEDNDNYGFNLTLNSCTDAELSCSVSSNSTLTANVDVSMKTLPISSGSVSFEKREPNMSLIINIVPNGRSDSQQESSTLLNGDSTFADLQENSPNDFISEKTSSTSIDSVNFITRNPKKSCKKVSFQNDDDLCVVYQMRHWNFAYREARKGPWELAAVDRCRFWRRIKDLETILSPFLRRKLEKIQET